MPLHLLSNTLFVRADVREIDPVLVEPSHVRPRRPFHSTALR
jgi:hypothetical protein